MITFCHCFYFVFYFGFFFLSLLTSSSRTSLCLDTTGIKHRPSANDSRHYMLVVLPYSCSYFIAIAFHRNTDIIRKSSKRYKTQTTELNKKKAATAAAKENARDFYANESRMYETCMKRMCITL